MKLQKAVKEETIFVALGSLILSVLMVCAFFGLNRVFPEQVPMGIPVILGAAGGREFLPDGADCAESSRN